MDVTSHLRKYCIAIGSFRGLGELSQYSDSLLTGRSGDRKPVGGKTLLTRTEQPWGQRSLLHNGYRVFPEGADHPHRSSVEVKERVEISLLSLRVFVVWSRVNFVFTLIGSFLNFIDVYFDSNKKHLEKFFAKFWPSGSQPIKADTRRAITELTGASCYRSNALTKCDKTHYLRTLCELASTQLLRCLLIFYSTHPPNVDTRIEYAVIALYVSCSALIYNVYINDALGIAISTSISFQWRLWHYVHSDGLGNQCVVYRFIMNYQTHVAWNGKGKNVINIALEWKTDNRTYFITRTFSNIPSMSPTQDSMDSTWHKTLGVKCHKIGKR